MKRNKYMCDIRVIHINNKCLLTLTDDYYDDYDNLYIVLGIYRKFSKRRKDYKRVGFHHGKFVKEIIAD